MESLSRDAEEGSSVTQEVDPPLKTTPFIVKDSKQKKSEENRLKTYIDDFTEHHYYSDEYDDELSDADEEYWNDYAIASGRLSAFSISSGLNAENEPLNRNRQASGSGFNIN